MRKDLQDNFLLLKSYFKGNIRGNNIHLVIFNSIAIIQEHNMSMGKDLWKTSGRFALYIYEEVRF